MKNIPALCLLACAALAAQLPPPTALPEHPFFIKNTWVIGGHGNWDYLTLDPKAGRLYIAHAAEVQVVDVETGALAGVVKGLREARSVALDDAGEFGYVTDARASAVVAFDRRSFQTVGQIQLPASPRALVYDADTHLLLAVSAGPPGAPAPNADPKVLRKFAADQRIKSQSATATAAGAGPHARAPVREPCDTSTGSTPTPYWESLLTLIDPEARTIAAEINICGYADSAVADANGSFYVAIVNYDEVLRIDATTIATLAKTGSRRSTANDLRQLNASFAGDVLHLDWRSATQNAVRGSPHAGAQSRGFDGMSLGSACHGPRALAIDAKDDRIFAACGNLKLAVLNTGTGENLANLPIGPSPEAVGFDADRGLIFTANGGAEGSLTVIRRDGVDSYNVVQTLATRQQARTLAVNSSTGQVYLVTVVQVAQVQPPKGGIGSLELTPEDASFQVLVVGN
jgi:DNA-binding beta-propeller fold protein YncE